MSVRVKGHEEIPGGGQVSLNRIGHEMDRQAQVTRTGPTKIAVRIRAVPTSGLTRAELGYLDWFVADRV